MPWVRGSPVLPGLSARIPSMTRSVARWVCPPMTTSAPHPVSSCPSRSSLVSGAIPGPSSAPGDAWTPSTAVPDGSPRRNWAGRPSRTPSRPAWSSTPRVQPMCAAIAAYRSTRSTLLAASATVACGAGCSPVRTYLSVFPRSISVPASSRSSSSTSTGRGPKRTRSPSAHQRSTPKPAASASTARSASSLPWISATTPSFIRQP